MSPVADAARVQELLAQALPLTSGDLTFRPPVEADRAAVHAYRSIPEVSRYLGVNGADPADFDRWWTKRLSGVHDGGWVALAIVRDGLIVGDAGLRLSDAPSVAGPTGELEGYLGYAVDPAFQGQGIASETARTMCHLGFDLLGLRRITAEVFAGHAVSSHVLRKTGFRHEGTHVAKVFNREGGWFDDEQWAMLRDEWLARRS